MDLARLRVDEGDLDRARVVTVKDVAEGAVTPIAAQQVELCQQARESVQHLSPARTKPWTRKQLAVREGVLDVAGDERRRLLGVGVERRAKHQPESNDRRAGQLFQLTQDAVLL